MLLLGKAEMLLTQSQLFVPLSLSQRIFRARRAVTGSRLAALAVGGASDSARRRYADAAFRAAPAAQLVLDQNGAVALVNERAQRDLPLSESDLGRPFMDLELAGHPPELRGSVASVQVGRTPVELRDVPAAGPARHPLGHPRRCRWRTPASCSACSSSSRTSATATPSAARLDEAQHDLATTREELESSSEELETTNEELQSAVEELETTNEELQSTNEELETMNEELQSTNEELQTLNDELRERTREVDQSNGFLQSIVEGLDLAVVVVDTDYRVQLWNGGTERLTGTRNFEAEGLRVVDLGLDFPPDALRQVLREVVVQGQERAETEAAVTNRFGRRHVRRLTVHPLRRGQGEVQGAVLSITDAVPDLD